MIWGNVFTVRSRMSNRNILDGLCWTKPTKLEWNDTEIAYGKPVRLKGQKLCADVRLHRLSRASHADGHGKRITID